jgi:hypothetical protein
MAKRAPGITECSSKKDGSNAAAQAGRAMPRSTKAREGAPRYGGLSREKPDWRVATWRAMRARTKL